MAILKGKQKEQTQEVVRFYTRETGEGYDKLLNDMLVFSNLPEQEMYSKPYEEWLAYKSLKLLDSLGVSIEDCVENKDVLRASLLVTAQESREEGEFYTPEQWAKYCRDMLKEFLIKEDLWGKAVIWDASCGTGNLLRTLDDYPPELIFQSTLNKDDVEVVQKVWEEKGGVVENIFELDFLNKLDYDIYNTEFLDQLPQKIQDTIKNNEPLVFFMNPPYKIGEAHKTDVGATMATKGMSKSALDIYHHFIYRIMLIKEVFSNNNIYINLIGPTTLFSSDTLKELYSELKVDHIFEDGIAFDIGEFSNVRGGTGWMVSFTMWRPKREEDEYAKEVELDTMIVIDGEITKGGKRVYRVVDNSLHYWLDSPDFAKHPQTLLPVATTFQTFSGVGKAWNGVLGYIMTSPHAIRGTRRTAITTLPNGDNMPIVEENFFRAVASFSARRCYASKQNSYDNSQYWAAPDMEVEGYNQWLIDSIPLVLFDNAACQTSYRPLTYTSKDGLTFNENIGNKLFPLSHDEVRAVATDEVLLKDLEENPTDNSFILSVIEQYRPYFSAEAEALYSYGCELLKYSLSGTIRKDNNYECWSNAWDAGLNQLRNAPKKDDVQHPIIDDSIYLKLVADLKLKLRYGVYKYKFLEQSLNEEI